MKYLFFGVSLYLLGQTLGWFQLNAQNLSKWWSTRPLASAIVFGIPCSMLFWYAWKIITEHTGSAWTARFIGSSAGLMVFPVLTWYLLGESMFTWKTMICFFLALLILFIQIYY